MVYKSFKDLPPIKKKKKKKPARGSPAKRRKKLSEAEIFEQAMQGVEPLPSSSGRSIAPERSVVPKAVPATGDARSQKRLEEIVKGNVAFEIEHTSEFVCGHVSGMNPKVYNQLKNGQLSTEAHLDLHGFTLDSAQMAVLDFVREQYLAGKRCLLLVTGRGLNSPQGRSLLRDELQQWLTREPLRRVVLAFATALPRHGGPGALYVLLRKYKKSQGKVIWDRYPLGKDF